MNGASVLKYLKDVCHRLDKGIDPKVVFKAGVTLAIPAAALFQTSCVLYGSPAYGVPFPEEETNCTDGYDDDYDDMIDCDDSDCRIEVCLGCFDGIDNDGDGLSDCSDSTCANGEGCNDQCADGVDNDGDGLSDCDDYDCSGSVACP